MEVTFDPSTYVPLPRVETEDGGHDSIPELADALWLTEALEYHGLSQRQVANILGCSQTVISKFARRYEIGRREGGRHDRCDDPRLNDFDWLKLNYLEIGRTLKAISKELGCGQDTLRKKLNEFGINTRGPLRRQEIEIPEWESYPQRLQGEVNRDVVCYYVARFYNVRVEMVMAPPGKVNAMSRDMTGVGRIHHARKIAVWLCVRLLDWNTTRVMHAWNGTTSSNRSSFNNMFKNADEYVKSCPAFAEEVRQLTQAITERR